VMWLLSCNLPHSSCWPYLETTCTIINVVIAMQYVLLVSLASGERSAAVTLASSTRHAQLSARNKTACCSRRLSGCWLFCEALRLLLPVA
jgi:hypothetical protein